MIRRGPGATVAVTEVPVEVRDRAVRVAGTRAVEADGLTDGSCIWTVGIGHRRQIGGADEDQRSRDVGLTFVIGDRHRDIVDAGCGVGVVREFPPAEIAIVEVPEQRYDVAVRVTVCSLVTMVPSGRVMQTGGMFSPVCGACTKAARKSNRFGHFRGLLALAIFPSDGSKRA